MSMQNAGPTNNQTQPAGDVIVQLTDVQKWFGNFQALRDITGQTLPHDAARWREWYKAQR